MLGNVDIEQVLDQYLKFAQHLEENYFQKRLVKDTWLIQSRIHIPTARIIQYKQLDPRHSGVINGCGPKFVPSEKIPDIVKSAWMVDRKACFGKHFERNIVRIVTIVIIETASNLDIARPNTVIILLGLVSGDFVGPMACYHHETDAMHGHGLITRDPCERFMDHPEAAPETDFVRGVDLDG